MQEVSQESRVRVVKRPGRGQKSLRTDEKPKVRKVSLTAIKKRLWAITRLAVFATYGTDCYTCPKKGLIGTNRQCGHVPWPSSDLSVTCRYDLRFLRPQCYNCNINKGGMGAVALSKMQKEGIDTDFLREESESTKGVTQPILFFENLIKQYTELVEKNPLDI